AAPPSQATATALAASPTPAVTPAKPPAAAEDTIPSIYDNQAPITWRWPLFGPLARGFQDDGNKGIDITAHDGETVAVAANGKVVYSGQGLIGYGNLVIVKHNDTYLSAYGNNSRLLVQEGDEVAAGQPIAEAGSVGDKPPTLHFEIRQAGKPVDPLDYLPRR
ncbi:murein hydrolase activator EnvC family protein, partial [Methylogaea oryzae]